MHTDKAIAEFEAWWDRQSFREQFEDVKDQMRNVWLASRMELVVKMPGKYSPAETDGAEAWNICHDCCQAAIEAAGVMVRGER